MSRTTEFTKEDSADKAAAADTLLEAAMTRALEARRATTVPAEFAARVRAALPERPPLRAQSTVGRRVAIVAAAVLLVLLFAIAPHTTEAWNNVPMYVELLVLVQLGWIAYAVSLRKI